MGISPKEQEMYFNQEYSKFKDLSKEKTTVLTIPLEEAVAEVLRVEVLVEKDYQSLLDADVEKELLDSYRPRAAAFIWSTVRVQTFTSELLSADQNWVSLKKEAVTLRKEIGRCFYRAFRNFPNLIEAVDRIMEGKSDNDLALDMLSYSKLGKENLPLLEKIGFEKSQLERSAELHVALNDILSGLQIDPDKQKEVDNDCNKAWTHLEEVLKEVYDGGRFAFPEGTDRHELYYNDYFRKLGELGAKQKQSANAENKEEKPVTA